MDNAPPAPTDLLESMRQVMGLSAWPGPDPGGILAVGTVNLTPGAKERARTFTGPDGKSRTVTPKKTVQYEKSLGWGVKAHVRGRFNAVDDLGLMVVFHLPDWRRRDVDNLLKALMDACNGVAWKDDSQVTTVLIHMVRDVDLPRLDVCIFVAARRPVPVRSRRKGGVPVCGT